MSTPGRNGDPADTSPPGLIGDGAYGTGGYWRAKYQRDHRRLRALEEEHAALVNDYDLVEAELRTLLTPREDGQVSQILIDMDHQSLAIYADQQRRKTLRVLQQIQNLRRDLKEHRCSSSPAPSAGT